MHSSEDSADEDGDMPTDTQDQSAALTLQVFKLLSKHVSSLLNVALNYITQVKHLKLAFKIDGESL